MSEESTTSVLLAEPDEKLRDSAQRALSKRGYVVVTAVDGEDALEKFRDDPSAIVITSVAMPRYDGLELLRTIKGTRPDTEVILLADPETIGSATLGLNDGAFTYLLKPVEDLRLLTHNVGLAAHFRHLLRQSTPAREALIQTTAGEIIEQIVALISKDRVTAGVSQPPPTLPEPREIPLEATASRVMRQILSFARGDKTLAKAFELLLEASTTLLDAKHAAILLMTPTAGLQLYDARGYADKQAAGHHLVQIVGEEFAWRVAKERQTLVDSHESSHYIGAPLVSKDQVLGVILVYPLKTPTPDPKRVEWLEAFASQCALAMELAQLQEEKERLSPNDPVSGALKRTIFLDLADREFRRCWRYDQPTSVLVIDLDGMHDINLQRGREFGDRIFHETASACRRTVRQIDLVGRYDGDAFAVLLVMTGREGARRAAERLSEAISTVRVADDYGPVPITATIGVGSYPREGCTSAFDLIQAADAAQKMARRAGANQIFYA
jgi:diguanylate cyclase (GGDEF)-like protein